MNTRKAAYILLVVGVAVILTLSFVPYTLVRLSEAGRTVISSVVPSGAPGTAVASPPAAPRPSAPEFDVAAWYVSHEEEPEKNGVLIETLDGRRLLASHNADTQFNPASLIKLATSLAALRRLGANHRFETSVYTTAAPDASGTVRGKLHVATTDPLFGDVAAAAVARELRARGVKHVTDGVTVSPGFSFNFSESPDESVERLLKALEFKKPAGGGRAKKEGAKGEGGQARNDNSRNANSKNANGRGANNRNATGRSANARNDNAESEQTTEGAREQAETSDVRRPGGRRPGEVPGLGESPFYAEPPPVAPLFVVESYTLREVLLYMNVHSSNFVAERIGALVGGAAGVQQLLIDEVKIPAGEVTLSTTSGLEHNRMTPRGLLAVIRALDAETQRQGLRLQDIMPIASDEGTLRHRFKGMPLESAAVGKTGTLVHDDGGMASLAGVIYTQNAGPLVFAVLSQGSEVWQNRQVTDQLLNEIITARDQPQPLPGDTPRRILQHDGFNVRQ
ncbi:MAG TPA: D-alanyl-D-alanine carboxypeptidase [Pyrinomonadaceae bacterium]|nr:D-alanyl-D-alanine carboxypeptidase [Pyrinomonadaceae bacterium]